MQAGEMKANVKCLFNAMTHRQFVISCSSRKKKQIEEQFAFFVKHRNGGGENAEMKSYTLRQEEETSERTKY